MIKNMFRPPCGYLQGDFLGKNNTIITKFCLNHSTVLNKHISSGYSSAFIKKIKCD